MPDIITMPDELYRFVSMRFNLVTINTSTGASSFNPQNHTTGPSAAFWRVVLSFTPEEYEDSEELERFVTQLKGGLLLARIYHLFRTEPRGAGGVGTTANVAADAAAGDTSIMITNLVPSEAISLRAMDHIGVGENLHRIVNSGPSSVGGEGLFELWPPLRNGVAADDPINLWKPTGLFRLTEGQDSQQITPSTFAQDTILTFVEEPDFDA